MNVAFDDNNRVVLFNHAGVVSSLLDVINDTDDDATILDAINALWFLAAADANKVAMMKHPMLATTLVNVMKNESSGDADAARDCAVKAFGILAAADENRPLLMNTPDLVSEMIKVIQMSTGDEAKNGACYTLLFIACAQENRVALMQQESLVDTLLHAILTSSAEVRLTAVSCLGIISDASACKEQMFVHSNLIETLLSVIKSDDGDVRTASINTILNLARSNANLVPIVQHPSDIIAQLVAIIEIDEKDVLPTIAPCYNVLYNIAKDGVGEGRSMMLQRYPSLLPTLQAIQQKDGPGAKGASKVLAEILAGMNII
jgi:hypothetical protein